MILDASIQHRDNLLLQNSYDSVSSYDSYNNRLGPNAHDDLKCGTNNGTGVSPRNHDPYRFTRSTAQPISSKNEKSSKPPDYNKYRYATILLSTVLIQWTSYSVGLCFNPPVWENKIAATVHIWQSLSLITVFILSPDFDFHLLFRYDGEVFFLYNLLSLCELLTMSCMSAL